jgi:RNA polymerase sigma factor (sigma-70 family)
MSALHRRPAALQQLFSEGGLTRRYTSLLIGLYRVSPADAEDIVDEVRIKCWFARQSFKRQEGSFGTWSKRILRNATADYWRRKARRPKLVFIDELPEEAEFRTRESSPEELAIDSPDEFEKLLNDPESKLIERERILEEVGH